MFEQAFRNIDSVLREDAGCATELDYIEQTSWMLFLKYLDNLEEENIKHAQLTGKDYEYKLAKKYRWNNWAVKKTKDGKVDHKDQLKGKDLKEFVDDELFPYLRKFKQNSEGPDTIEYKISEVFGELKNKMESGYGLRGALEIVDSLSFKTHDEKCELSYLYESKIKNMGNAGRNGGEYYTPRPLIKAIVKVVNPQIGQTVYDGAVGSAGFLCEAFGHMSSDRLSARNHEILQKKTFYGKEKKSLAYVIAIMNMVLHGIETPNILHTNTLTENIDDIQEKDRYDVVLANPPFGSQTERDEIQENFQIRTSETAFLFLQHFIKKLRAGGSAGVVIKNTFLSNSDNASVALRKELLESSNLHTILDMPKGTFLGSGVRTVVLFFKKGSSTKKIWYYQLDPGRNLGKTNALNDKDMEEFVRLQKTFKASDNSWTVNVKDVNLETFDLSAKNPNKNDEVILREPKDIMKEIVALDKESENILKEVKGLL